MSLSCGPAMSVGCYVEAIIQTKLINALPDVQENDLLALNTSSIRNQ
jgi:hypothetical protein